MKKFGSGVGERAGILEIFSPVSISKMNMYDIKSSIKAETLVPAGLTAKALTSRLPARFYVIIFDHYHVFRSNSILPNCAAPSPHLVESNGSKNDYGICPPTIIELLVSSAMIVVTRVSLGIPFG